MATLINGRQINPNSSAQLSGIGIGAPSTPTTLVYGHAVFTNSGFVLYYGDPAGRTTSNNAFFHYGQQIDVKVSVANGISDTGWGRGMFNNLLRNFDPAAASDSGTKAAFYGISTHCGHYNSILSASPVTTSVYAFYNKPYLLTGTIPNYYGVYLDTPSGLATPSTWASAHAYSLGTYVKPSVSTGYYYVVTTAGTSGGTEPVWNTTIGGTTTDGSVTWTTVAIPSITNYWGFYQLDSAARNFFNGRTLIGTATDDGTNKLQVNGGVSILDGNNLVLGTTTGTKIGTSASQKIGFFSIGNNTEGLR